MGSRSRVRALPHLRLSMNLTETIIIIAVVTVASTIRMLSSLIVLLLISFNAAA